MMRILLKIFRVITFTVVCMMNLSCEQQVYTGEPESPPPANCILSINSFPAGLEIYVGQKNNGYKTPSQINWLAEGSTKITLKKDWFRDSTFYVDMKDKETTYVFIDHRLNPRQYGKIIFNSIPNGSDVFMNGTLVGKTPCQSAQLWPGYYAVKVSHHLCRSDSSQVLVRASVSSYANRVLEDTSKWVSYNTSTSKIPSDFLYSIVTDLNNVKWLASDDGVISFDGKKWMAYNSFNSPLPKGPMFEVAVDQKNNKWVASPGGLFMFNGTSWLNLSDKLPTSTVLTVTCDEKGIVWVGTNEGLVKFDGASWTSYTTKNSGIYGDRVSYITVVQDGKVWFASFYIGVFDGTNWFKWTIDDMKIDPSIGMFIRDLKADKNGNVWVAHSEDKKLNIRGGLTKYDGSLWSEVTIPVIATNQIQSIDVDEDNYKWIGASRGLGKFTLPEDTRVLYHLSPWIPLENIRGITIDNNGDLWVATFGGGIAKIKKGNY